MFPGSWIASSPFLEGEGTQSGQFDAVTVDQGLCQGGHNGVYGFLSVLSVHVACFGQIGNEGGFGDGGHGAFRAFCGGFCLGTEAILAQSAMRALNGASQ